MNETSTGSLLLLSNEIQLLLSEKRTALSMLRTGIAVFALPLPVLGLLIATSSSYRLHEVLMLLWPLLVLSAVLVVLGIYLGARGLADVHRCDRRVDALKARNQQAAQMIDGDGFQPPSSLP